MSETALITQAYRFALAPTPTQDEFLASCAGASRFWFNAGLALVKECLERRQAEGDESATSVPWSYTSLCSEFALIKDEVCPWRSEVVVGSQQAGLEALGRALQNFSKGRLAGRRVGFPHFREKGRCHEAVLFQRPRIVDGRHVMLDRRLGPLRSKERLHKLIRLLERDEHARILRSTVQREGRTWFISFTVQRSPKQRRTRRPDAAAGVDVGLLRLATLSTGEVISNAKPLQAALGQLARYQRQLARQRRLNNPGKFSSDGACKPSRRDWVVSARQRRTQERIQRLHERVAHLRRHQAHVLTTRLTREFGVIGVESLAVANLMKNKRLARHIADVSWGTILQQLKYKTDWSHGSLLVAADRFYPSSKTCSGCGAVRVKLSLSERVFACDEVGCGLVMDRDLNAAVNLARLATIEAQVRGRHDVQVAGIESETLNARGGHVSPVPRNRQSPVKREESMPLGVVSPQGREALASAG